ncbi:hypothetical protein LshimejAT787_1403100 [Lyophyllum shimeji]|uniref:Uncharacterized protein n=1 Tax=Lyophyllum shimeji TaxID=47721 RepID=A0A9P3PXH8_LYOSH|nr:hypothetical protein LshimejAT787_1403100 [Lyophyllum shimeji]
MQARKSAVTMGETLSSAPRSLTFLSSRGFEGHLRRIIGEPEFVHGLAVPVRGRMSALTALWGVGVGKVIWSTDARRMNELHPALRPRASDAAWFICVMRSFRNDYAKHCTVHTNRCEWRFYERGECCKHARPMTVAKKTHGGYARPHPSHLSMAKAKRSQTKIGIALDTSELILTTLANAARLTPVPYLQNAAGVALNIVNIIQGVQSNKSAFLRLANDACALVYIILCRDKEKVPGVAAVTPAYLDHARELADTLHEIYNYTKLQSSRNKLIRMIQYKSDAATIQEYRDRLKQSLDIFTLKSTMSIQDTLAAIKEQVSTMADQTRDIHEREVKRQESLEMEAAKQASLDAEKASEKVKLEQELEKSRSEQERTDKEKAEQERVEKERAEKARAAAEAIKGEQERVEAARAKAGQDQSNVEQKAHQQSHVPESQPTLSSNPFRQQNPFFNRTNSSSSAPHSASSTAQSTPFGVHSALPGPQFALYGGNPALPGLKSLPYLQSAPGLHPPFPGLQYAHPGLYSSPASYMSVAGDRNTYSGSVVNTNSGNTSNTVITNSNNDNSVRTYQGRGRRR